MKILASEILSYTVDRIFNNALGQQWAYKTEIIDIATCRTVDWTWAWPVATLKFYKRPYGKVIHV